MPMHRLLSAGAQMGVKSTSKAGAGVPGLHPRASEVVCGSHRLSCGHAEEECRSRRGESPSQIL